jgi:hypothetical protein
MYLQKVTSKENVGIKLFFVKVTDIKSRIRSKIRICSQQ